MTLSAGTKLGPYEVLAPIGSGGMGEVYRARDARLNRDVAIKVLPVAFAADHERLARFQREAQVLASLNHPHIASIYGLEKAGEVEALVLELVEGETLAERLARGPLPVDEALEIARQIADALEAAHERGIVHRDLKPSNVKLTPQGRVKVLDFGLAKAVSGDSSSPDATHSPTLTAAATQGGVVIGTAAYMSPEQARGKTVDRRADIWAFGTVLYEMLAGRRVFEGETVSDTLAAVLRADVDWSALPPETPASVRRALRRCLDRDLKTRFHDVADVRIAMDEPLETPPTAAAARAPRAAGSRLWPFLAALAGIVAILGWWRALVPGPASRAEVTRLSLSLPSGSRLPYDDQPVFGLSRDGRQVAVVAERDGATALYLRRLDATEPRLVEGTANAKAPFFSPDGRWIGFFSDGKLKKVPVEGGSPVVLADAVSSRGGVWLRDDSIVFSQTYTSGLSRVSSRGGKTEILTEPDGKRGERTHRWPSELPDGRRILFTVGSVRNPSHYDEAEIDVLDLTTRERHKIYEGGSMARWVPGGRLVVVRNATLLALPFDERRLAVTGDAVPAVGKISGDPSGGAAYFSVAADGTLAYARGGVAAPDRTLVLVDRKGVATDLPLSPRPFGSPRFSPDGKRLAFSIGSGGGADDDVFVYDIASNTVSRLTFGVSGLAPVWSPDGKRIAFSSIRGGVEGVWVKAADGTGEEKVLDRLPGGVEYPNSWSDDGRFLAIRRASPTVGMWLLDLPAGPASAAREAQSDASGGALSPDGRFFAYSTGMFAQGDIFVQPTDGSAGKWQITTDHGGWPVWRGREIFFLREGGEVWAVEAETTPAFRAGSPRLIHRSEGGYLIRTAPLYPFDASYDGRRFVMLKSRQPAAVDRIDLVLGWASELGHAAAARP